MALPVYEVFGQERDGAAPRHAGSLLAPSVDLAVLLAQELFCRRQEYREIWVVARSAVRTAPTAGGALGPAEPRSYRLGSGYRATVEKWKRFGGGSGADR